MNLFSKINAPPRIPLSNELDSTNTSNFNHNQSRSDTSLLDFNYEFEFSVSSNLLDHERSSTDELFLNGIILPIQLRKKIDSPKHKEHNSKIPLLPSLPYPSTLLSENSKRQSNNKTNIGLTSDTEQKPHKSKFFWGFMRSSSLRCENKKSLLCSLPLLSRSKSTSLVPNGRRTMFKEGNCSHSSTQKQSSSISLFRSLSSSSSSSHSNQFYSKLEKPLMKKNCRECIASGVSIFPMVNLPRPYITKANGNKIFDFGSFLHHGKGKKTKI